MAQEKFDGYFEYFTIGRKINNNFEGEKLWDIKENRSGKTGNIVYRITLIIAQKNTD